VEKGLLFFLDQVREEPVAMKKWIMLAAVCVFVTATRPVAATPLPPNTPFASGGAPAPISAAALGVIELEPLLATLTTPLLSSPSGLWSAKVTTSVYQGGSGLDFVYTVQNQTGAVPPASFDRITLSSYLDSISADVYAESGSGLVAPSSMDRILGNNALGFNFGSVVPNGDSVTLLVRTNATAFGGDILAVEDGGSVNFSSYAPAPLPSSLVLFGTGILGFAGGMFRRLRKGLKTQL
jgi:hypothetical protein